MSPGIRSAARSLALAILLAGGPVPRAEEAADGLSAAERAQLEEMAKATGTPKPIVDRLIVLEAGRKIADGQKADVMRALRDAADRTNGNAKVEVRGAHQPLVACWSRPP